jgi:ComF family protein
MTQFRPPQYVLETGMILTMVLARIETLLMPARCAFCATRCESPEAFICKPCMQDLPWRTPLCSTDHAPLTVIAAPLEYAFPIDAALKLLKFQRRCDYVPPFAELLWQLIGELPGDIDALLPMPLHWRRQAMRGFNQAFELSRVLQKRSGLPLLTCIRRVRATPFQSGLDAADRRHNLRNAFHAQKTVTAKHVLIVDDVITTGETCARLAAVAIAAGAKKVSALAVARA